MKNHVFKNLVIYDIHSSRTGKSTHAIKFGKPLFRLGPSTNHGYVSHSQRVFLVIFQLGSDRGIQQCLFANEFNRNADVSTTDCGD